ncbi:MAG: Asp23/Gls24 family envelope stress response protein [Oscillospiraceae bacterium]|nr:Asp23/Gls24 family envelope stress response protein [Oscillospiraceae bacterium]
MRIKTEKGHVFILPEVFTTISGYAATNSFGVKGMAARNAADGFVRLLRRDSLAKGVKVTFPDGARLVNIELHIVVEMGVNMPALCEAIISEVRYVVEKLTGVSVGSVDIYVDSVMTSDA